MMIFRKLTDYAIKHRLMMLFAIFFHFFPVITANSVLVGQLRLSKMGIGTWSWGNRFLWNYSEKEDDELQKAFNFASSKGINWYDTADSYGTGALEGRSESLLGQFANEYSLSGKASKSSSVKICTKIAPFPWRIGKDAMLKCIQTSRYRLNRPIDMLQMHWPPTLGWQESEYLDAFQIAIKDGIATQVGLSNFGPIGLLAIQKKLQQRNIVAYSNQVQFSLLSRLPLQNGLVDICKEQNVQLISYSPLALGLLTDKYSVDKLPKGPRSILFREYLPVMKPLLDTMRDIAQQRQKTVAQVALNWNLSKGFLVLVGARTPQQVEDNVGALSWALSSSEIDCIDIAANKVPKSLIQNANQSK